MKNHARILQKGIQTAPVGWSGLNLHEGIAPQGKKGGKEGRGGKEEDPEPQPGFDRHCPVGFGQGKDGAHDGNRKRPEKQRTRLACPEGSKLVEDSQGIVRVPCHILKAVVADTERIQEYDGSKAKSSGNKDMAFFDKGRNTVSWVACLGEPVACRKD